MLKKVLYLVLVLTLTACQVTESTPTATPLPAASPVAMSNRATSLPRSADQPTSQPTEPAGTPLPHGGTARLGLIGQPDSLNPITDNHPVVHELAPLLFDTLLQVDPQSARLQPSLAESWEYRNQGQQVIFQLRPNLTWSDGTPLTAADVATSLKATQHPARHAFSSITALNDTTLALTFAAIDCAAVTTLSLLPLLPASAITATMPMGSGPFRVAEWPDNQRSLTLEANPNYRGPGPILNNITIRFLRADEVNIAQSEGQFDLIGPLPAQTADLKLAGDVQNITYPAPQVIYLALNYGHMKQVRVEEKRIPLLKSNLEKYMNTMPLPPKQEYEPIFSDMTYQ